MQEREFATPDVLHILQTGNVSQGFWNAEKRNYEATVSGWDLDGEELELAIAIDVKTQSLVILTGKRAKESAE